MPAIPRTHRISKPDVQECDFEGRGALDPQQVAASPLAACFDSGSLDQHLVYTGKKRGGGIFRHDMFL